MIVAVLDTNVLISGLLFDGPPRQVLQNAIAGRFLLVLSPAIIQEFAQVLARPKFRLSPEYAHNATRELEEIATLVQPTHHRETAIRDPKDRIIVDCAVEARAGYIVTGDQDLLVLQHVEDVSIVSPASFLKLGEFR